MAARPFCSSKYSWLLEELLFLVNDCWSQGADAVGGGNSLKGAGGSDARVGLKAGPGGPMQQMS